LKVGKIKELSDVSITADHPHIHAALTPEAVPAKLMLLRLDVFQPLRFGHAMIPVRKAADPIRVTALPADVFFTGAANFLNSVVQ
jgi:hypothetical protein